MPIPKRPLPRAKERRPTPASPTGTRREPSGRVRPRDDVDSEAAALETFEREPERGREDARLVD